jgi:hypothetical protein
VLFAICKPGIKEGVSIKPVKIYCVAPLWVGIAELFHHKRKYPVEKPVSPFFDFSLCDCLGQYGERFIRDGAIKIGLRQDPGARH